MAPAGRMRIVAPPPSRGQALLHSKPVCGNLLAHQQWIGIMMLKRVFRFALLLILSTLVFNIAVAESGSPLKEYPIPKNSLADGGRWWSMIDYDAIVLKNVPDQREKYEACALAGDSRCAAWWASVLAERAYAGIETGYSGSEIVYFIRLALCNPVDIKDNDRDGPKLDCVGDYSSGALYLELAYRNGLFGLPQSTEMAECWRFATGSNEKCQQREVALFGKSVLGTKPSRQ
jgi:hypothetical protein